MKKFLGIEISEYGIECGYVDYATLRKSFDCILNNEIIEKGYWELIHGDCDNYYPEVFQWYIISESGADILREYTDELIYYNDDLNLYVWGVTHFGTGWDCVLTDIKID